MEGDSSLLNILRKLDFRGYRCPTTLLPIAIDVELSMSPFFLGAVNDAGRRKKAGASMVQFPKLLRIPKM